MQTQNNKQQQTNTYRMVEKQGGTKLKRRIYPNYPLYRHIRDNVDISLTPKQLDHVRTLMCLYG